MSCTGSCASKWVNFTLPRHFKLDREFSFGSFSFLLCLLHLLMLPSSSFSLLFLLSPQKCLQPSPLLCCQRHWTSSSRGVPVWMGACSWVISVPVPPRHILNWCLSQLSPGAQRCWLTGVLYSPHELSLESSNLDCFRHAPSRQFLPCICRRAKWIQEDSFVLSEHFHPLKACILNSKDWTQPLQLLFWAMMHSPQWTIKLGKYSPFTPCCSQLESLLVDPYLQLWLSFAE